MPPDMQDMHNAKREVGNRPACSRNRMDHENTPHVSYDPPRPSDMEVPLTFAKAVGTTSQNPATFGINNSTSFS